jgi:hypothetical protein
MEPFLYYTFLKNKAWLRHFEYQAHFRFITTSPHPAGWLNLKEKNAY